MTPQEVAKLATYWSQQEPSFSNYHQMLKDAFRMVIALANSLSQLEPKETKNG